jgi:hypothetical protein
MLKILKDLLEIIKSILAIIILTAITVTVLNIVSPGTVDSIKSKAESTYQETIKKLITKLL